MRQSDDVGLIAKALVCVQKELRAVIKDSKNPHFKNTYASLDATTEYVRPILAANGLAVVQGGGDGESGTLVIETMLLHESGQWISSRFPMPMEKNTPQAAGSAITYGRRYGLAASLALTTDEDDDGHTASQPKKQEAKPAPVAPSDDQLRQIQDLAIATGDWERVGKKMKTLTEATANDWIARLTKKLKEMEK